MSALPHGQFYNCCFFLRVWATLSCLLHSLECGDGLTANENATKLTVLIKMHLLLFRKCFQSCFKFLIADESSEKVGSNCFCQFLVALLEGCAFGVPYSVIFTNVSPVSL